MKKFLTLALGSLMIVSCGLYNKYERPDVNATGLIRDAVSDVDTLMLNTDQNFGQLPWRELFTDPQLQGLIELALENNTDLRNAMYDAVRCRLGSMYCHQRTTVNASPANTANVSAAQGAQGWSPQQGQPFPAQEETDDLPF